MRIYSPDQKSIFLDADTLEDAIELQALSTFSFAARVGIRVQTNRNQFFRAIIPVRPAPTYPDFAHWFGLWDTTKDPEIKRLCETAWRAALAYAYAEDPPDPPPPKVSEP